MAGPENFDRHDRKSPSPAQMEAEQLAAQANLSKLQAMLAMLDNSADEDKHLESNISKLIQAIDKDPNAVDRYLELADLCHHRDLNDEAIAILTEAIERNPNYWPAYTRRAWIHAVEDRRDQAIADSTEAIRIHPSVVTRLKRAYVYSFLEDFLAAIADCDDAVRAEPDNPECYEKRALHLAEWYAESETEDLLRRAIQDDTTAMRLQPNNIDHVRRRGRDYLDLGCHEEAIADLNRCVQQEPDYYLNFEIRGEAFLLNNQPELALKDLDRAIALNAEASYSYESRSKVNRILGRLRQADEDERRWKELDPYYEDD